VPTPGPECSVSLSYRDRALSDDAPSDLMLSISRSSRHGKFSLRTPMPASRWVYSRKENCRSLEKYLGVKSEGHQLD
jgi:hypothetical protein